MLRDLLSEVALFAPALFGAAAHASEVDVARPAPEFELADQNGQPLTPVPASTPDPSAGSATTVTTASSTPW